MNRPFRGLCSLGRTGDDRQCGAVAVEFALVSILLIVLIVGMVNIAHLCQVQILVTQAAREGARLAAVNKFNAAVVQSRVGLDVTVGPPVVTADASGKSVSVASSYDVPISLPHLTGLKLSKASSTITLTSLAVMKTEY